MSELNITDVRDMAYSLYKGKTANFDAESANEAIKNIILKTAGCEDGWDMYKFMDNKYKVFAIMREILTPVVAENVLARFESWVDIEDIVIPMYKYEFGKQGVDDTVQKSLVIRFV